MKNKIIPFFIILIVLISMISWVLWSILFFKFTNINYKSNNENQETRVEEKITNISNLQSEITKIVKDVSPWVVSIVIKKDLPVYRNSPFWFFSNPIGSIEQKVWWWTWFFITKDWKIITNKHVIDDSEATYTVITNDNNEYDAKVIATDPNNDLAILEIIDKNKEFKTLDFVSTLDEINVWQFAIAVWNALSEFQNSVSLWVVSWKNRNINDGINKIWWLIQTDAAINPGNSWWPLIDLDWKVMWINTAIIEWSEWLWFSISLTKDKINYMLDSVKKYGVIKKTFVWINYIPITSWVQKEYNVKTTNWLYVINQEWSVVKWSPAEKAWIKPWDVITKIDWINLWINYDLNQFIQNKLPWNKINLSIVRGNEKKEINIIVELWEI